VLLVVLLELDFVTLRFVVITVVILMFMVSVNFISVWFIMVNTLIALVLLGSHHFNLAGEFIRRCRSDVEYL
jgi:hypothetical protein